MKKVAIMTLFNNNYNSGAILQAFALKQVVNTLGYDCTIIDYKKEIVSYDINLSSIEKIIKLGKKIKAINSKGDIINLLYRPFNHNYSSKFSSDIKLKKSNFKRFINENMEITETVDKRNISELNKYFDIFICGSDQIWRPSSFDPNYFLSFVDVKNTKFSYAASLGVKSLLETDIERMKPLINNLGTISIREKSTIPLIKSITDRTVECVLDPTLLLGENFWSNYTSNVNRLLPQKYIFSYIIGDNNKNRDIVAKISKMTGLPVVAMPGVSRISPYDFKYADENMVDAAPDDFLSLIKHADMVITDSFHACVFSLIFKKNFYALERFSSSDPLSMNSRIYDLLEIFSAEDRLISKESYIDNVITDNVIEYDIEKWNKLKESSIEFLRKSLET